LIVISGAQTCPPARRLPAHRLPSVEFGQVPFRLVAGVA
jgi:hypothetical protein